ncbi:MAG TPA: flagellar assembly protein FliX [Pseudolabrys sp.]|nr:flagellar assembly protein FliX [Pseudolabrys sp.]
MRVYGPNGSALAAAPTAARRSAAGTFTVSEEEMPRNTSAAGSLRTVSTVDALIALQGVEDPRERKKRAVNRGRKALDVLDTLKLAVLDGSVDPSTLMRLKVAAEGLTEETGDPGLDGVLGEIDLRVAVELAKAGIR